MVGVGREEESELETENDSPRELEFLSFRERKIPGVKMKKKCPCG